MNEDRNENVEPHFDDELRQALIDYLRLSTEAVNRITEASRASRLSFSDAAVQTSLVTSNEVAEARAWVRATMAGRNRSVIETALHRQSGTRALTVRPSAIGKPSSRLIIAFDSDNPHSERIRALRTEVTLLSEAAKQAICFSILSPRSAEGRSQLSAELAIAFSQIGRRTLLVDADLRRPSQHLLFGADCQLGLAQSLAYSDAAQMIAVEGLPFLSVVPSGPVMPNPSELLSGSRFGSLIRRWRNEYEVIIVDTPPVSQFADALTIAAMSGNVLVVSRANSTPYRDMKEMLRKLGLTKSRILGGVISTF
jgi:protein-tyrosine kinase